MATTSRAPLSRERILQAALALVDEGGIDSLSMRKLGQKLGFEAMSLYNHVENKDDVIDGILDLVLAEGELPSANGVWDAALRESAISVHAALQRHPWACALVMAPGHITLKWCKEALETIPRLRVFLIDGLRDRVRDSSTPCGVNEVKLRRGQIVREGLHTTLTDLRLRKTRAPVRAGSRRSAQDRRCSWSGGTKGNCRTFGGTRTR